MPKRAVKDVPIVFRTDRIEESKLRLIEKLADIIAKVNWPYRNNIQVLQLRDHALIALCFLSGCRISEAIELKKIQFEIFPDLIYLANVQPLKHGLLRKEILLPLVGPMARLSMIVREWLEMVPDKDCYVFASATPNGTLHWHEHLKRKRPYWILKTTVDLFPHWLRGCCETYYGKGIFKSDAWKLKEFMGLKSLGSTSDYVSGSWEENKPDLFK
jgi:integrase